jgi:hemolysin D
MATANQSYPVSALAERASQRLKLLAHRITKPTDKAVGQLRGMVRRMSGGWEEAPVETARKVLPAAISFQTDLEEIVEELPPRFLRISHYFAAAMFAIILLIAGFAPVEMVVQGSGQLTTDAPPIVLQPIERAIVRELKVRPGDIVAKGQLLAVLDATFAEADMAALVVQERSLTAQLRRIEAEQVGAPYVLPASPDDNDRLQESLYRQRQAQYGSRVNAYDEEINRAEASIQTIEGNRDFLAKQLDIAKDVEGMRSSLWKDKLASKLQLLDAQSLRLRAARDHQDSVDRISELRHTARSKRAERQAFVEEWRRSLLEELVTKRTDAARLKENLVKAAKLRDLVQITAPEDGVVLEVAKRSVGSIMREAEPLITLVPSNAPLIAEIMISSVDVGYTKAGDPVAVKVDAFPYQRHGMLEGRLASVSEASFSSQSDAEMPSQRRPSAGGSFHRARVELPRPQLAKMPEGARLIPGMTMSADIKVGSRSVLAYFLNPVTRGLDESMREP